MLRTTALLPPLLAIAAPAAAQQSDAQLWAAASASIDLGTGTGLEVDTVARFGDAAGGLYESQSGVTLRHAIADGVEAAIGYRHAESFKGGRSIANEERLRQQVTVALGGGWSTRLRFEQRFHSSGGETGVRFRPQIRYLHPLGRGLALSISHESYVNFNTTRGGQDGGYDRMRNAAALKFPIGKGLKGEAGYLNQYRPGRGGARDRMDHVANFSLSLTL